MSDRLHTNADLRAFLCARGFATTAYQMVGVGVGWQVYELTHSALHLGFVGLAQFIPLLALVLVTGQAADRYDRRLIVSLCQVGEGAALLVLAAASLFSAAAETLIFLIVFLIGVARAFEYPTMQTMLPSILRPEELPRGVAMG
ncbi:MAG TPA: MFS transporter, partial [Verrucomicrobiae bacterium]|nr:MFS transporter [Verrucomicrobiae bacterium]